MSPTLAVMEDVSPSTLEGWAAEDVRAALDAAVDHQGRVRFVTGLLLWKLRTLLPDGDYGAEVDKLAVRLDVTPATLGRWRNRAEEAHGLAAPDARTAGARAKARHRPDPPGVARPRESPERVTPTEVIAPKSRPSRAEVAPSAGPVQLPLPGAEAWGVVAAMTIDQLAGVGVDELKKLQRRIAEALRVAQGRNR